MALVVGKVTYAVYVCPFCYEQASQSYTGDPHLTCEHASTMSDTQIKALHVTVEWEHGKPMLTDVGWTL